ncbi:MAG: hypothetical protein WC657_06290 [Candidatus Paceibacterota bacterium]
MESTENLNYLWPFKGGTWKERRLALADALKLVLLAIAFYYLFWRPLAPFF